MPKRKAYITLKVIKNNNGEVETIVTRKSRRVFHFIQRGKSLNCVFELRVVYGKGFKNEGSYRTKKDLRCALKAFVEF